MGSTGPRCIEPDALCHCSFRFTITWTLLCRNIYGVLLGNLLMLHHLPCYAYEEANKFFLFSCFSSQRLIMLCVCTAFSATGSNGESGGRFPDRFFCRACGSSCDESLGSTPYSGGTFSAGCRGYFSASFLPLLLTVWQRFQP